MSKVIDITSVRRTNQLNNAEIQNISTSVQHDTQLSEQYTKRLGVMERPDFFNPVEAPLTAEFGGEQVEVPGKKAIIRDDTGQVVSVVGSNYKVIKNADVFSQFDGALADSGIDLTGAYKTVHLCAGGAQTVLGYSFPAYARDISNREVGDTVRLSVTALNSYNGYSLFEARFSQERLACKNSMVGCTDISYFAGKHTANLMVEHAVEKIKAGVAAYLENVERYQSWVDIRCTDLDAERMFQRFCVKKGYTTEFNEKRVNEMMALWRTYSEKLGANRWALFNVFTHWSTHSKVNDKTIKSGNAPLSKLRREEELRKFLPKTGWFAKAA